jgi:hypothetical protein
MNLVRPSLHHLLYLTDRAASDEIAQYEAFSGLDWDSGEVAAGLHRAPGVKYALLGADNLPIAAGGYTPVVTGTWESWMLVPSPAWKFAKSITREARSFADRMLAESANRLETIVLADREAVRMWYERGLGMRAEGVKRGYGANGEDAVMYARVKGA